MTGKWTEWEMRYLRLNWDQMYRSTIAKNLGRSRQAVSVKGRQMKLGPGNIDPRYQGGKVKIVTSLRPCIRCRNEFQSAGKGNRLCKSCLRIETSPFEDGIWL